MKKKSVKKTKNKTENKKKGIKKSEESIKKELRILNKISKKVLKRRTLRKIKLIEDLEERLNALRYSLNSELHSIYDDFETKIKNMQKKKRDVFFLDTKLITLRNKIKLFNATYHKKDFNSVLGLIKQIKKEIKDV